MIAVALFRERENLAANLRRIMARDSLTQADVMKIAGLNAKTVERILTGSARPQPRTLAKLAVGLGVSVDELLYDARAAARKFDRDTNDVVREFIAERPQLFRDWTQSEIDDLASRFAVGGAMTEEGILKIVHHINRRREVVARVVLLWETEYAAAIDQVTGAMERAVRVA